MLNRHELARRAKTIADEALYRARTGGGVGSNLWKQPGGVGTPIQTVDPTASVQTGTNVASGPTSVALGGTGCTASGPDAACLGGVSNQATNLVASCIGGSANTASGGGATCIGGFDNTASGSSCAVIASYISSSNGTVSAVIASDESSTNALGAACIGTAGCAANGNWSACAGGENNTTTGQSSVCVGGRNAIALREDQVAHGSANATSNGSVQQSWLEVWGTTPGAAMGESVELKWGQGNGNRFPLENGKAYAFTFDVIAGAATSNLRQMFKVLVCAGCQGGIATIDQQQVQSQIGSAGAASWTFLVTTDGAANLIFTFTTGTTTSQCAITAAMKFVEIAYPTP